MCLLNIGVSAMPMVPIPLSRGTCGILPQTVIVVHRAGEERGVEVVMAEEVAKGGNRRVHGEPHGLDRGAPPYLYLRWPEWGSGRMEEVAHRGESAVRHPDFLPTVYLAWSWTDAQIVFQCSACTEPSLGGAGAQRPGGACALPNVLNRHGYHDGRILLYSIQLR
jgi:hypothetical protein